MRRVVPFVACLCACDFPTDVQRNETFQTSVVALSHAPPAVVGAPQLIDDPASLFSLRPAIATGADGVALAVWQLFDGTRNAIASNRLSGTAWGTPVVINPNLETSSVPQVAVDDQGNGVAVWRQTFSSESGIFSSRSNNGAWELPVAIHDPTLGLAAEPQIAVARGHIVAIWKQVAGTRWSVSSNRLGDAGWGTPALLDELIDDPSSIPIGPPQVAVSDQGTAIAVWAKSDGTRHAINSSWFDGVAWTAPVIIDDPNQGSSGLPQVATDAQGTAIAIWSQFAAGLTGPSAIYGSHFDGASWTPPVPIDDQSMSGSASGHVAMNTGGTATAVWVQWDGTRNATLANRFDGNAWGKPTPIDDPTLGFSALPQVAIDERGNIAAVWIQSGGPRSVVLGSLFTRDSWSAPVVLDDPNLGGSSSPRVSMAGGAAVAIWTQLDPVAGSTKVYANTLTAPSVADRVASLVNHVQWLIDAGILTEKDGKKLLKQLDKILKELGKGKTDKVCKELGKFVKEATKLVNNGILPGSQGQELIDAAHAIITSECGS